MSEEKKFNLKADFDFFATDLDHAFELLADHFQRLQNGEDTDLIAEGSVDLRLKVERIEGR